MFLLASQLRYYNVYLPLAGFSGWNDEELIRKAGEAVGGSVFSVDYAGTVPGSPGEKFRKEYQEVEEFEIIVERRGLMDVITLRAEVNPKLSIDAIQQTNARLKESLKIATNLSFHVIIEPPGSLPRYMLKAKRFRDMREGERNE